MHRCQVAAWLLLPLDPIFSLSRSRVSHGQQNAPKDAGLRVVKQGTRGEDALTHDGARPAQPRRGHERVQGYEFSIVHLDSSVKRKKTTAKMISVTIPEYCSVDHTPTE